MSSYEIWHDNDFDVAHWLYLNSDLRGQKVDLRQIPKTNNPRDLLSHLKVVSDFTILPAIKYETPDLIVVRKETNGSAKIIFLIEFMTHTPQHDHPLQRFTRIYGASWLGIPSALVIPQKKEKLERGTREKYKPTIYRANPLIYHLFIKLFKITQTPTFLLMWPEHDGYLKYDRAHPTAPHLEGDILLLLQVFNSVLAGKDVIEVARRQSAYQEKLSGYIAEGNHYELTSGEIIPTSKLKMKIEYIKAVPKELSDLRETFLYSPTGLKSGKSSFRTDPYAGKICAFDILFCRDESGNRVRNLVLEAKNIPSETSGTPTLIGGSSHSIDECPFISSVTLDQAKLHLSKYCPYTERKQQRIYGEIPSMVVYEDGEFYVP